jgi:hypothetical protein
MEQGEGALACKRVRMSGRFICATGDFLCGQDLSRGGVQACVRGSAARGTARERAVRGRVGVSILGASTATGVRASRMRMHGRSRSASLGGSAADVEQAPHVVARGRFGARPQ